MSESISPILAPQGFALSNGGGPGTLRVTTSFPENISETTDVTPGQTPLTTGTTSPTPTPTRNDSSIVGSVVEIDGQFQVQSIQQCPASSPNSSFRSLKQQENNSEAGSARGGESSTSPRFNFPASAPQVNPIPSLNLTAAEAPQSITPPFHNQQLVTIQTTQQPQAQNAIVAPSNLTQAQIPPAVPNPNLSIASPNSQVSTNSGTTPTVGESITQDVRVPNVLQGDDADAVLLGVQQLEKQQAELEARREAEAKEKSGLDQMKTGMSPPLRVRSSSDSQIPSVRRPPQGYESREDEPQDEDSYSKPLVVFGYLQKRTRNGCWQRRFFETDGERLTYYKSQKRSNVLATLDLAKVGDIAVDIDDETDCTFSIQVAGRPYFLRAEDRSTCKDWVINLNRVREARIQVGNIKLVAPHYSDPNDYLGFRKESNDSEMHCRVVLEANRDRTEGFHGNSGPLAGFIPGNHSDQFTDIIPQSVSVQVLGEWDKRKSSLRVMRSKLIRWARKVKMLRCIGKEQEIIFNHREAPGATDNMGHSFETNIQSEDGNNTVDDSELSGTTLTERVKQKSSGIASIEGLDDQPPDLAGHSAWVGKEKTINLHSGGGPTDLHIDSGHLGPGSDENDLDTSARLLS
eukprot:CAMPEP_0195525754 /NCGR_PEP_ID=MMETSP0794_2-20130614/26358_1 /TAXON_ID=515487 /ORGANISM="Stephanopyxis turris, Strain CCMP 815" /LENGTH=630 /DNA_ID=CAMNT_0040656285 /DNA_START=667 /DNA_END=2559 /DNA_ORIENTATION=+